MIELAPTPDAPWARVFWKGRDPLRFAISKGANRFDPLSPPWQATKVLYAGETLETAIAETVLRWHGQIKPGELVSLSETAHLRDRRVARIAPKRALTLINASGLGLAAIESVITKVIQDPVNAAWNVEPGAVADDIFQCNASEYLTSQQWCAWFRSQCPKADGLTWVSRQFNSGRCIVLFDDRCGSEFKMAGKIAPLYKKGSSERATIESMLMQLGWGVDS